MSDVFLWRKTAHVITSRQPKLPTFFAGLQAVPAHRGNITLTDRHQGAADAAKRQALVRGGR